MKSEKTRLSRKDVNKLKLKFLEENRKPKSLNCFWIWPWGHIYPNNVAEWYKECMVCGHKKGLWA